MPRSLHLAMIVNSIGIVGYGHFGQFVEALVRRFLPDVDVRVFSRRAEIDGQTFYSLADVGAADVVVLCGAIREYETQLRSILPYVHEHTVLVDVATVKKYPTSIFQAEAGACRWVSCHPMFGPESYKKTNQDVSGFRIVVTDYTLVNDDYVQVKAFLQRLGFLVIEMSADEHDRLLAETLFLTHYIGQTIHAAGFQRTNMDTVSFQSLMNAVESVVGDKQLFEDVYRFNPYCTDVAQRFHAAQEHVFQALPKD